LGDDQRVSLFRDCVKLLRGGHSPK
jgi:hypothetical protein